jgi:predicted RNA binding protein YcfA (HicA-like mRNA interferase family)
MPKKIRELKEMLLKAGFTKEPERGKGSHTVWTHPNYNGIVTISGKDGKDAQRYQERDVKKAIAEIQKNES